MATDRARHQTLLSALEARDWSEVLTAVSLADAWAQTALVGDPMLDDVAGKLAELASHPKWEVRRAVANVAAHVDHPTFEPALARLALDDNARVRHAAQQANFRRRDSRNASALGEQHAERINATLDQVEARFGLGPVNTYLSASKMSTKWMKPMNITSSFSNRENIRR